MTSERREDEAGKAMGGLLAFAMHHAHEDGRTWFFGWERDAVRWLHRHLAIGGRVDSLWTKKFVAANPEGKSPINFNLRALRAAETAPETQDE